MSIIYTWKITGLKTSNVANNSDVVVQTYWNKKGVDEDGNSAEFDGATPFYTNNIPEGTTFIPFSELTEDDIISWIESIDQNHVDQYIEKQINLKKNPVVEATLPWTPVSNTETSNT